MAKELPVVIWGSYKKQVSCESRKGTVMPLFTFGQQRGADPRPGPLVVARTRARVQTRSKQSLDRRI